MDQHPHHIGQAGISGIIHGLNGKIIDRSRGVEIMKAAI